MKIFNIFKLAKKKVTKKILSPEDKLELLIMENEDLLLEVNARHNERQASFVYYSKKCTEIESHIKSLYEKAKKHEENDVLLLEIADAISELEEALKNTSDLKSVNETVTKKLLEQHNEISKNLNIANHKLSKFKSQKVLVNEIKTIKEMSFNSGNLNMSDSFEEIDKMAIQGDVEYNNILGEDNTSILDMVIEEDNNSEKVLALKSKLKEM